MKANKLLPHLHILPEDNARAHIAKGFELHHAVARKRFQVLHEAGGWSRVLEQFEQVHLAELRRLPNRFLVLLIDFDSDSARRSQFDGKIPPDVQDRVFVIGSWKESEDLKNAGGTFETIGTSLAEDCHQNTNTAWNHPLLQHNAPELTRMHQQLRPFLFEP